MTLRGAAVTCLCTADFAAVMRERVDLADPLAWPGLEVVKDSTVRTVSRGTVSRGHTDGFDVHLKQYRAVRLSDRARDALSGSRAVKELRNLLEARRRGLPCAEPLCAGRWTGSFGARSFLVTRTIEGGRALPRGPLPPSTAARAGELLRDAHDAGLSALDLHPGNVVEDAVGALWLLDLQSAVLSEPLENDERARAIAFFCLDLDGGVHDPAAAPLLEAYRASPALVAQAAQAGRRQRTQALVAFGRRATRPCRHTTVERRPDGTVLHLHRPAGDLHDALRAFLAAPRPDPLKSGRRGAVWLTGSLAIKQRPAAAARRLFQASYLLLFAEVPSPQPVGLVVRHGVGLCATRRVDAPNLRDELEGGARLSAAALGIAAESLGRSVGRLHALGLRNRDLKLDNLVRDPQTGAVLLVDLDGLRRKSPLDRRGLAKDLGRLLAAWTAVGHPQHALVVRTFWRSYHRSLRRLHAIRCLRPKQSRNLRRRSEVRAREWRRGHASIAPRSDAG